jgi:hypothetical protein
MMSDGRRSFDQSISSSESDIVSLLMLAKRGALSKTKSLRRGKEEQDLLLFFAGRSRRLLVLFARNAFPRRPSLIVTHTHKCQTEIKIKNRKDRTPS